MVVRFSANFSENCSEAVSGRLLGSRWKFKTMQACKPFSPTQYVEYCIALPTWPARAPSISEINRRRRRRKGRKGGNDDGGDDPPELLRRRAAASSAPPSALPRVRSRTSLRSGEPNEREWRGTTEHYNVLLRTSLESSDL